MPLDDERKRRRRSFDEHAALYDSVRPSYPDAVFDGVVELAELPRGARMVEIGCGTGQATVPLARRGYRITCVELGGELAAIARRNLASFPDVEVVNASFEAWEPPRGDFDAVVSFSAFDWLDPEIGYRKSASLLRPGGALAIVTNRPVLADGGDPFLAEVREDYEAVGAELDATQAPRPDQIEDRRAELEATGLFVRVDVRRLLWSLSFDARTYTTLISTYSAHRAMAEQVRERLFERIRARIDARPERRVEISYLALLGVGRTAA
jgi:SAM-dependent methyltransferase